MADPTKPTAERAVAESGRPVRREQRHAVVPGVVVSEGIAIGTALVFSEELSIPRYEIAEAEVRRELARFEQALMAGREQLERLRAQQFESEQTGRVLESQLLMLVDPLFMGEVIQKVRTERKNAEAVVSDVVDEFSRAFEAMEDPYMRDRCFDIQDVGHRILRNLLGTEVPSLEAVGPETVLICHQLAPSDVANLSTRKVMGIASEVGGVTSHAAILARALGIPALVGVSTACTRVQTGDRVILDAMDGALHVNPTHEEVTEYRAVKRRIGLSREKLQAGSSAPPRTHDGVELVFRANISMPAEVESILSMGAQGVGLLRTEYLYMSGNRVPTEEEQYQAYRRVVAASQEHHTVIRTLDIGGDKHLPYLGIPVEPNPFLGWRSIRFCLDNPVVFKSQLRAILRASAHGTVRIMYPMVSTVEEVRQANELLAEAKAELDGLGTPYDRDLAVGVMIEVPSAALISDQLAKETAFFAVGTNDLIQYTMAVDRTNERMGNSFELLSVPVLRLIRLVTQAAERQNIPVSCCGEIGASPVGFVLLLGLGIREFSMNAFNIPQLKQVARHVSAATARELATHCLELHTLSEVRSVVDNYLGRILAVINEATPPA